MNLEALKDIGMKADSLALSIALVMEQCGQATRESVFGVNGEILRLAGKLRPSDTPLTLDMIIEHFKYFHDINMSQEMAQSKLDSLVEAQWLAPAYNFDNTVVIGYHLLQFGAAVVKPIGNTEYKTIYADSILKYMRRVGDVTFAMLRRYYKGAHDLSLLSSMDELVSSGAIDVLHNDDGTLAGWQLADKRDADTQVRAEPSIDAVKHVLDFFQANQLSAHSFSDILSVVSVTSDFPFTDTSLRTYLNELVSLGWVKFIHDSNTWQYVPRKSNDHVNIAATYMPTESHSQQFAFYPRAQMNTLEANIFNYIDSHSKTDNAADLVNNFDIAKHFNISVEEVSAIVTELAKHNYIATYGVTNKSNGHVQVDVAYGEDRIFKDKIRDYLLGSDLYVSVDILSDKLGINKATASACLIEMKRDGELEMNTQDGIITYRLKKANPTALHIDYVNMLRRIRELSSIGGMTKHNMHSDDMPRIAPLLDNGYIIKSMQEDNAYFITGTGTEYLLNYDDYVAKLLTRIVKFLGSQEYGFTSGYDYQNIYKGIGATDQTQDVKKALRVGLDSGKLQHGASNRFYKVSSPVPAKTTPDLEKAIMNMFNEHEHSVGSYTGYSFAEIEHRLHSPFGVSGNIRLALDKLVNDGELQHLNMQNKWRLPKHNVGIKPILCDKIHYGVYPSDDATTMFNIYGVMMTKPPLHGWSLIELTRCCTEKGIVGANEALVTKHINRLVSAKFVNVKPSVIGVSLKYYVSTADNILYLFGEYGNLSLSDVVNAMPDSDTSWVRTALLDLVEAKKINARFSL